MNEQILSFHKAFGFEEKHIIHGDQLERRSFREPSLIRRTVRLGHGLIEVNTERRYHEKDRRKMYVCVSGIKTQANRRLVMDQVEPEENR